MFYKKFFSPNHRQIFRRTTKPKTNALKNFPPRNKIIAAIALKVRMHAAEINPKARDPDECMHSKPCQAYSSQEGANETAQPEGCK